MQGFGSLHGCHTTSPTQERRNGMDIPGHGKNSSPGWQVGPVLATQGNLNYPSHLGTVHCNDAHRLPTTLSVDIESGL